jgi:uracil-DNA glycosylase family 4
MAGLSAADGKLLMTTAFEEARSELLSEREDLFRGPHTPNCPPSKYSKVIWGHGAMDASIMLVGSHPNFNDDATGFAFSGDVGEKIRVLCETAGVSASRVYKTYIVKLSIPPRESMFPTAKEYIRHGRLGLERELAIIKPRVVVAFGTAVLHYLAYYLQYRVLPVPVAKTEPFRSNKCNGKCFQVRNGKFNFTVVATDLPYRYNVKLKGKRSLILERGFAIIPEALRRAPVTMDSFLTMPNKKRKRRAVADDDAEDAQVSKQQKRSLQ